MQSNFIVGALTIAFIVYITARGELPTYLGFFGLGGSTAIPATVSSSAAGAPSSGSILSSALPAITSLGADNIVGSTNLSGDFGIDPIGASSALDQNFAGGIF